MSLSSSQTGLRGVFHWVVATLIAVHACMAVTRVTATLWVLQQGLGAWTAGVVLSLFAVAPLCVSLWAGRLADRYGLHRPVALAAGLAALGALGAWWEQNLITLGISCLACGGAVSMAAVAIQREAGLLARSPADLKRVFSWVAMGPAVSNAVMPVIAGFLIDHAGFSWAFALAVVLPVVSWALAKRVPRSPPRAALPVTQPAWQLLRDPRLRHLLAVNVVLSACWDAHMFVVPVVGHAKHLSASSIGVVLGAFAVAASVVRLLIARFGHRFEELSALRLAMGGATATLFAYIWLPGEWGMVAGSACLGLMLGSVQPMILSALHQVAPTDRLGQALALRMLAVNSVTIAMPLGFGALASVTVVAAPMWLMAVLLMGAQWPVAWLRAQGSARQPAELTAGPPG